MSEKMPPGPDFSQTPARNQNLQDMTTRVKGMREGLELRREALAAEKAPAATAQTEHGAVEATIEKKEAALKALAAQHKSHKVEDGAGETSKETWEEELGAMRKAQMQETPPEAWEEHYKDAQKAKEAAEAMGYKVEVDPVGRIGVAAVAEALAPEIKNKKTPESAKPEGSPLKPAEASVEEKEALLAALAAKNKEKVAPLTPEMLQTNLDAARKAFAQASEERKAAHKAKVGFFTRAKEKMFGPNETAMEQVDAYKLAKDNYEKAKLAMARNKLGALDAAGKPLPNNQKEVMDFIEKEMGEYSKLGSPEKQGIVMRAMQAYARMPVHKRILISLAISTVAMTGVIALTGGFAGVGAALSFAGYRIAKSGAGAVASTAATEVLGSVRNTIIDSRQKLQKAEIEHSVSTENLGDAMSRVEALAGARKKFDTKTGIYKALTAGVIGGGMGLASAIDAHMHAAGTVVENTVSPAAPLAPTPDIAPSIPPTPEAPDVFKNGTTPWNSQGYSPTAPNLEAAPVGKVVEGAPLAPAVDSTWPPAQGFGDAQPLAPEAPHVIQPEVPVIPIESMDTTITIKPGDNLWKLNEHMLMQNKEFASLSSAKQQWVLSTIEKNGYGHLSQDELVSRGFGLDTAGKADINNIQTGTKMRLFDLKSSNAQAGIHRLIEQSNTLSPAEQQNILSQQGGAVRAAPEVHTEVPLPPERPVMSAQVEAPANDISTGNLPSDVQHSGAPDITPSGSSTESAYASAPSDTHVSESVAHANTVEAIAQPLNPQSVKGAWPLLAKGIMSKPEDVYSNYYGRMNFKGLGLTFDQYKSLNNELIAARDTYNINFDNNKLVGKVLEELAQKRGTQIKSLAA